MTASAGAGENRHPSIADAGSDNAGKLLVPYFKIVADPSNWDGAHAVSPSMLK